MAKNRRTSIKKALSFAIAFLGVSNAIKSGSGVVRVDLKKELIQMHEINEKEDTSVVLIDELNFSQLRHIQNGQIHKSMALVNMKPKEKKIVLKTMLAQQSSSDLEPPGHEENVQTGTQV